MNTTIRFKNLSCTIHFDQYSMPPCPTKIWLHDAQTGEPIATATVYLLGLQLEPDEVVNKNCSENEGVLQALIDAGVVHPPHRHAHTVFIQADICRLRGTHAEERMMSIL